MPERITSRKNELVRTCRMLARSRGSDERRMLLDGRRLLEDAAAAGVRIHMAAFSASLASDRELATLARRLERGGTRLVSVTEEVLAAMSPAITPSGVVGIAETAPLSVGQILAGAPQLLVILVDVQDPGNVGAIIRSADAAGATGVLACGATADPFGWKALRGAMGSAFRLPVARSNAEQAVMLAKNAGIQLVAAAVNEGRAHDEIDFTRPTAILVGSEGAGLPPPLLAQADRRVTIPMRAGVESLNVAVAASLLVYEARRQRVCRSRPDARAAALAARQSNESQQAGP